MTGRQSQPLRFGVFLPPQNVVGLNPTLVFRRAVELGVQLERVG
jgi:limonene 1,2-monooxygenase